MPKFPPVVHITQEADDDKPYLIVHEDGFETVETDQDVAVYKLVSVGAVKVERTYVQKKGQL
jgi:hypothetical protein